VEFDGELADWLEIAEEHPWKGVLLGNGASMVLWPKFGYRTLFQVASELSGPAALSEKDQQLFRNLRAGGNFEQVLHDLAISLQVADALGGALQEGSDTIRQHYTHIRTALIEAVHAVHVPYSRVALGTLRRIGAYLGEHDYVFSTNYDLIVYRSMMQDAARFTDCFLDGDFEPSVAELDRTKASTSTARSTSITCRGAARARTRTRTARICWSAWGSQSRGRTSSPSS